MNEHALLSEEEMKALPRKVGRMKLEEVRRLAQEMEDAREAHERGLVYTPTPMSACPHCTPIPPWREIDIPCAEMVALQKEVEAWAAQKEHRLNDYDAVNKRNKHSNVCKTCTFKDMYYDGYFSCVYSAQIRERWRIYVKRIEKIGVAHLEKRFEQEHGRPPRDILEFVEWQDKISAMGVGKS
jgi:hypothetical protein